jgi:hypothetical protein
MTLENKTLRRRTDVVRDKPITERAEHGNLDRPGAFLHPRAESFRPTLHPRDWSHYLRTSGWN